MKKVNLDTISQTIEVTGDLNLVVFTSNSLGPSDRVNLLTEFYNQCFLSKPDLKKVNEVHWTDFKSDPSKVDIVLVIAEVFVDARDIFQAKGGRGIQEASEVAFQRNIPMLVWGKDSNDLYILREVIARQGVPFPEGWRYTCNLGLDSTEYTFFEFYEAESNSSKTACRSTEVAEIVVNAEEEGVKVPVKVNKRLLLAYLK